MATVNALLTNFTAGELSPRLYGRVDLAKYQNGARTVKNFVSLPQGGARRRGGTQFVAKTKDNNTNAIVVEFTFSTTQSYMLEFGEEYIRFFRNRGIIYDLQATITGATNANPCVITAVAHGFSHGDRVVIGGVLGMTELDNREFTVANKTTDTFEISGIDSSAYGAYTSGGTASRVYEIVTNYAASDIAGLTFTQSADTLYIFHPDWPITLLTRTGHAAWTIGVGVIEQGPFLDYNTDATNTVSLNVASGAGIMTFTNATLNAAHVGALFRIWEKSNGTTFGYAHWAPGATATVADGSYWEYEGNVYYVVSGGGSALGSTAAYPTHKEGTVSVFYGGGTAEMRYEHSGYCVVQVSAITDTKNATITVVKYRTPYSAYGARSSAQWQEGAWSDLRGYPVAGTFHEQRLCCAGNATLPSTFWASETGAYLSFKDGDLDTDGYKYSIASDQADAVKYVASAKRLALLTTSSEYVASGASGDAGITPTNIKVSRETNHGTANVRPIRAGPAILVAQRAGDNDNPARKVRELVYQFQTDSFVAPDLTILSDHITASGLTSGAFVGSPDLMIWYSRGDGDFVGMTYERDQQVVGWHHHSMGANSSGGLVKCVAAIPGVDVDELWMVVERVINGETTRCIEWLQYGLSDTDVLDDAQFLDCSLKYDGTATTTVSGLWHLEGETIDALADSVPVYDLVVSGGSVTLPNAASVVTLGYNYQSLLETLHIEAGAKEGTAQGRIGRAYEVVLRLNRSVGGKVGRDGDNLDPIEYRLATDTLSSPVALFTGDKRIAFDGGWDRDRYITISSDEPLPLTVTCLTVSQRIAG